ncbi:crotonase/enoyl-CoA hydratase family protein [Alkalicaulis satelles]|uniref:Crotonase/enoyl-CoA hydratase family protein n=1 Tax=Alkalicaulis satelles TaxID=2609175 RepID=A0A5M6ZJZ8_9PROT|nr:crotonase/enoyl-CoA hydratase family protein [Alkalicaulis satelles]KAA5805143.1 crotonase/enoyl-CoA hydratase family protein [Alkalicaulis satelles]
MSILYERDGPVAVITINRPTVRNALDGASAAALAQAVRRFEADEDAAVAALTGAGGHFCAGADLKSIPDGTGPRVEETGDGPLGPTRMVTSKPVIAAVEGYAVAGGLELALWCDLRVASQTAVFGVFCRRFGVPLVDGGTVRLPRLIGQSRAMDMILTGRAVEAEEALAFGLANRVVPEGEALARACELAREIAAFPQTCLQQDRMSALEQWGLGEEAALANETRRGLHTLSSGETLDGAQRFSAGAGRHGRFDADPGSQGETS